MPILGVSGGGRNGSSEALEGWGEVGTRRATRMRVDIVDGGVRVVSGGGSIGAAESMERALLIYLRR
jgi:hypothetical protein